jgi:hypothetical protein
MEQVQDALETELDDVVVTATGRGLVLRYEDTGECFLLPNATLTKGSVVDDDEEDDDDFDNEDEEDDDEEDDE